MKKLFIAVVLSALMVTPALAEEPINGNIAVDAITLFAGSPGTCDVDITLNTCALQGPYTLEASATGDLICEGLEDAHMAPLVVDVGLGITLVPGDPPTFGLAVNAVQMGPGDLCP
jgi:hypothetical protein